MKFLENGLVKHKKLILIKNTHLLNKRPPLFRRLIIIVAKNVKRTLKHKLKTAKAYNPLIRAGRAMLVKNCMNLAFSYFLKNCDMQTHLNQVNWNSTSFFNYNLKKLELRHCVKITRVRLPWHKEKATKLVVARLTASKSLKHASRWLTFRHTNFKFRKLASRFLAFFLLLNSYEGLKTLISKRALYFLKLTKLQMF